MTHPSLSDEFWENDDEQEYQDALRESHEYDQAFRKNQEKMYSEMYKQDFADIGMETNSRTNCGDVLGK